ncbi:VP2 protein [Corriparta virus]|uniref:VP2 protein n=1 Tax=Corriparta virus TaxID=40053 RepID=T1ST42_9REOV|nr:VP2 protein [Corriparta virus]AGT51055.1 VP2 protein [Corriparta virus]
MDKLKTNKSKESRNVDKDKGKDKDKETEKDDAGKKITSSKQNSPQNEKLSAPLQELKKPAIESAPYLRGDELHRDAGPLLSIFGLQEILSKIRETQIRMKMVNDEPEISPPDVQELFKSLNAMSELNDIRIINRLPTYYRHVTVQSDEKFFQVNTFCERISQIGVDKDITNPQELMEVVLDRIRFIREEGSFMLHGVETHYVDGFEVVSPETLGLDVDPVLKVLKTDDRRHVEQQLNFFRITNTDVVRTQVDQFQAAMPEPIYRVHSAINTYVFAGQQDAFRRSLEWLQRYGEAKDMDFDKELLTDVYHSDTIYMLSYTIPANTSVVWEVPRCHISNLMLNASLGLPGGTYILPNAKISTVTITSRIITSTSFSQMDHSTATEPQIADVRKIYLALMFPNQIILDIRGEPGHAVDPISRGVAGVVGKLMLSYGPNIFNITSRTARLLDKACAIFFQKIDDSGGVLRMGPTANPLDFRVERGARNYDCNVLASDPNTGRGFNGYNVNDVRQKETPYPHVRRRVCYTGYDAEEVLDERYSGEDYTYAMYDTMVDALQRTGHTQEANYLRYLRQHHIVRFAYLSQVINRDLLSAFSLPDDQFRELAARIPNDEFNQNGPVVLDISYASLWHAFKMRFLPTDRPQFLSLQPLIESVYASQMSLLKFTARSLQDFVAANQNSFSTQKGMDIWKVVTSRLPEPLKHIFDIIGQKWYINMADVGKWLGTAAIQQSLPLLCETSAWLSAHEPQSIMFARDIYVHRTSIPEPFIEDIDQFRREAEYFTNMIQHQPPIDQLVVLNRAAAIQRAGEGRLKMALRQWMDGDLYIRIGDNIRPIVLSFHTGLPSDDILKSVPYTYNPHKSDGPVAKFSFGMCNKVYGFVIFYAAEDHSMPDELTNINPTYSNSVVVMNPMPFSREDHDTIFAVANKNLFSIRKKTRVYNLTPALVAGTRHALPLTE